MFVIQRRFIGRTGYKGYRFFLKLGKKRATKKGLVFLVGAALPCLLSSGHELVFHNGGHFAP